MAVSRTRLPHKPMKKASDLVDFEGFKDARYWVLAVGSFLVNLGLYSPYFYVGGHTCFTADLHLMIITPNFL